MKNITTIVITGIAILSAISLLKLQEIPKSEDKIPSFIHESFSVWAKEHKKTYSSPAEYTHRLTQFYKNYLRVNTLQAKGEGMVQLKLNKFSDMSREEFKAKHTGYRPRLGKRNYVDLTDPLKQNPTSVDWRNKIAPIKNQKNCGACWAYGAVVALEFLYTNAGNQMTPLSEQELVDCSSKYGNGGCNGGNHQPAFEYVMDNGIGRESDYPYVARQGTCKSTGKARVINKITTYQDVPKNNAQALETAVSKNVVSIAVDSYNMMQYSSGIMTASFCDFYQPDHAVALVGYGVDGSGKQYWIMRNSWGTDWGIKGYAYIEKNLSKTGPGACGVRVDASYPQM